MKNLGTKNKTKVNTYLALDGRYHDPDQLESYFVERPSDFVLYAQEMLEIAYKKIAEDVRRELIYGSDEKNS